MILFCTYCCVSTVVLNYEGVIIVVEKRLGFVLYLLLCILDTVLYLLLCILDTVLYLLLCILDTILYLLLCIYDTFMLSNHYFYRK